MLIKDTKRAGDHWRAHCAQAQSLYELPSESSDDRFTYQMSRAKNDSWK